VFSFISIILQKIRNSMKATFLTFSLLAFLLTFSTQTLALDFTVNLTTDEHDADTLGTVCDADLATPGEQCTLRAAIEQANALSSNDRVLFSLPANSTIYLKLNNAEIPIQNNGALEIIGTSTDNLTIYGSGAHRIFYINEASAIISEIILRSGTGGNTSNYEWRGGAIFANGGSLTLDGVYIRENKTEIGGGIYFLGGTHRILNSTISDNTGNSCGGFANSGNLTIINSTISGNSANGSAGGFCTLQQGSTVLRNVTVTNNGAKWGGGIQTRSGGALNLGNTIVADNNSSCFPEMLFSGGTITSVGGNLIGDAVGDSTDTNIPVTYHQSDIQGLNPMLNKLTASSGEKIPTHGLSVLSPAIDAGLNDLAVDHSNGNAQLGFDQRGAGFPRIADGDNDGTATVDIGAYEGISAPPPVYSVSGQITNNGNPVAGAIVTVREYYYSRSTTTNWQGYYSILVYSGGPQTVSYTVTPYISDQTFTPSSKTFNSVAANQTVNFTATRTCPAPIAITSGQIVNGILQNGDCNNYDAYTFNGTAGQQIYIRLDSVDFMPSLYLYQRNYPGGTDLYQGTPYDAEGTMTRIPYRSGYVTLPHTGIYTILATPYTGYGAGSSYTGSYRLSFGTNCSYSINPNVANIPAAGDSGTITVTASPGCSWNAVSNDNWITLTSNGGTGNGTVSYSVAANTGVQRNGSITISGQNFPVTQTAASYNISGTVIYGNPPADQTRVIVSGVLMTVPSDSSISATTDLAGVYLLKNLIAGGNYTVTASKTGNINGISPFDATLVLRHVAANGVGPNALNANQQIAADASGDGNISPFDATLILRYIAAGTSNANTGQVGNWKFDPASRPYQPLNNSMSNENYSAILVGEVNGNWTP
jgi:hypothetical protein